MFVCYQKCKIRTLFDYKLGVGLETRGWAWTSLESKQTNKCQKNPQEKIQINNQSQPYTTH